MKLSPPLIACLVLLLLPSLALAERPAQFEARLELSRNGKTMGELTFTFSSSDEQWTMASATNGTRGLARFLGLRENSTGTGDWYDHAPRPLRYERQVHAIKTMEWTADFDWTNSVVRTVYPKGESTLELEPGVVDESALGLIVRAGLALGQNEWRFRLVDEDEIEDAHFRTRSVEAAQTPLGCMQVHVVEKVRGAESKRYTRTFYAEDHAFVPVVIQHGQKDGNHVEARITSLSIDGKTVEPGPACPEP
jgi:hypothetical protein